MEKMGRRPTSVRRGILALGILGALLSLSVGYWLATNEGSLTLGVTTPPAALRLVGVASVTQFATVSLGAAQDGWASTPGLAVARVTTSAPNVNRIKVLMAWTNVATSAQDQWDQVAVGLYKPVHQGACSPARTLTPSRAYSDFHYGTRTNFFSDLWDPRATITTPTSTGTRYCVRLLTSSQEATRGGRQLFTGKLLLSRTQPTALFEPMALPATAISSCQPAGYTTDSAKHRTMSRTFMSPTSWCRVSFPHTATKTSTPTVRSFFVVVSVTHGHADSWGQHVPPSALRFYIHAF